MVVTSLARLWQFAG